MIDKVHKIHPKLDGQEGIGQDDQSRARFIDINRYLWAMDSMENKDLSIFYNGPFQQFDQVTKDWLRANYEPLKSIL